MTREEFDNLLRLWGYAFGPRNVYVGEEPSDYGDSPLARICGRPRVIRREVTMDRGGRARRQLMGAAALPRDEDDPQPRLLPAWAVAPIRFAETRTSTAKILSHGDRVFSPEVMQVEGAVRKLQRVNEELGGVVRAEYCSLGQQQEKASRFNLARNAYRERLAEGRGWLCRELAEQR